jgi:UDP-glucose 4-epimerase
MRILLTGATGFIGSYVLNELVKRQETVAILIRPTSNHWRIRHLLNQVSQIYGDLNWSDDIARSVCDFAPEAVIHLGWSGVGNRYRNDFRQVDENLHASLNLLRLAHDARANTWIGMGSQAEYGPKPTKISEDSVPRPTTLYGATKLALCTIAEQMCAQAGMRFAWLRLFSSYGPMDDPSWMIPSLIQVLLRGEKPSLTAGEQLWDYIFVSDAANAVCEVVFEQAAKGIFNLGSGEARPLRQIVELIRDKINRHLPLGFGEVPYRPDQVMHLEADITRLRRETNWFPRIGLDEGIERTIGYYRQGNPYAEYNG